MDEISRQFAQLVRKKLRNNLKKIILFGSHARGDYTKDSDYDFLVIVKNRDKRTQDLILDASVEIMNKYYALAGSIVCDEKEWQRKKYFPIGLNIIKEGVEI